MRGLVAEARRAGMLPSGEAARLTDIPNIEQAGARKGNWLTREQVKEILVVPDRSKLVGNRDYVILSLLVACALRRTEFAELDVATIQERESRWVLVDLEGKGRRIRTVAIPIWVKQGIDAWTAAAEIKQGWLLRPIRKCGKIEGECLSDWAVWSVVGQAAKQIGIEQFGAHDLRRTCAKLCRQAGGDLEQIQWLLGHSPIQTTGAVSWVRAGDSDRRERHFGILAWHSGFRGFLRKNHGQIKKGGTLVATCFRVEGSLQCFHPQARRAVLPTAPSEDSCGFSD